MAFVNVDTSCIADESLPWFPFAPHNDLVSVKLLAANPATAELVVALRAAPGIELPRHRLLHAAAIYTLQGRWKYRERNWIVGPGSLLIESAGTPHTPQVMADGSDDAIVLVFARGAVQLLDGIDRIVATEDWRTTVERYRTWCRSNDRMPSRAVPALRTGPLDAGDLG
jgi:2,4'-dihydroxyacetophenone dioxygenase